MSTKTWTVEDNLRQMQVSDDAYVARDLARFNHHPNAKMFMPGGVEMDLPAHVNDMLVGLAAFPDLRPHNHNYKIAFGEGQWTAAVSDVTATNTGPVMGPRGQLVPPTGRKVNFEMATVAHWADGLLVEEYVWTDTPRLSRQLGFLPSPLPADPTIGLEMGFTLPLSTRPDLDTVADNKARMKQSDDALNAGNLDPDRLHYANDIVVYGADEQPIGLDAYLEVIRQARTAFPDLRLDNDPYVQTIGQGDWTATVARLTGTHTGPLQLPAYLAPAPVPATGKGFNALHYTIARWQDGQITHLKLLRDPFALLGQLGLA